ncbi:alpha/beta hydrolase [Paenibacillus daejeonensis]|uniref:alpha/beta hydrolase n=1 Tax=Paenibacillus daejeonensis TaxID=135193 RepID=UPI0003672327|nr:alpha/beta fold hydrolase [Paenibacillus daejeonensis]
MHTSATATKTQDSLRFIPSPSIKTKPLSRRRRIWVALLSSLLLFGLLLVLAFHGFIAWFIAYPYVAPLISNPMEAKNLAYSDVSFPSASGRTAVHGWYIPAPQDSVRTIVFSHGYGANREETWVPMYELTERVHTLNYNVLLFDYGYASKIDRAPVTGGQEEAQQLLAAIDYVRVQGSEEIIVWGFSMGAGTALQAALHTDAIDALILDSTFLADPDTLFDNVRAFVQLPRFPSKPLIQALLPLWTGTSFSQLQAEEARQTAFDLPIYMMHGTADDKAPVHIAEAVSALQTHPLSGGWIVPGGKHELLFQVHPEEYIQRTAHFLSQVHADDVTVVTAQ